MCKLKIIILSITNLIDQYNKNKRNKSLIEIIEEKGFEQNFNSLTTKYIELFCKICSKDKVDKKQFWIYMKNTKMRKLNFGIIIY